MEPPHHTKLPRSGMLPTRAYNLSRYGKFVRARWQYPGSPGAASRAHVTAGNVDKIEITFIKSCEELKDMKNQKNTKFPIFLS